MRRWIVLSIAVSLIVIALALVQTQKEFVAACSVTVTRKDGRPAANVRVSESWNAYSYDLSGGQDIQTDAQGKAFFPPQLATHSVLFWSVGPVLTRLNYGVHASSGITSRVALSEPGFETRTGDILGFSCSDRECTDHPLTFEIHLTEYVTQRR